MKKYKLIKGRIEALRDIPLANVKAGDLGGLISKEENLSQKGECWVEVGAQIFGNAKVSEDAQVYGDAKLFDDSMVWGNAKIYGKAMILNRALVWGNAHLYGRAQVYGSARVYGNAEISGDAEISGVATIIGDAKIHGEAHISGRAKIQSGSWETTPLQIIAHPYVIQISGPDHVTIAGQTLTIKEWEEDWEDIASELNFDNRYKGYFNILKEEMK